MTIMAFSRGKYRELESFDKALPFEFVLIDPTDEQITSVLVEQVREIRDSLLRQCDWTQLTDSPMNDDIRHAWSVFRQALRDITDQNGFPMDIIWPIPPSP